MSDSQSATSRAAVFPRMTWAKTSFSARTGAAKREREAAKIAARVDFIVIEASELCAGQGVNVMVR